MAPRTVKRKRATPWPLKSCSSATVFAFFGWPDNHIYNQRYKSLLDAGQQTWHTILHPQIGIILISGSKTLHQNEAEPDVARRLMSELRPLMNPWNTGIASSEHWKPLCRHVAYWSKRRYLASNAWKTLLLRQRRISIRTLPSSTLNGCRRSGRGRKKVVKFDASTCGDDDDDDDGSTSLGEAAVSTVERSETEPEQGSPPPGVDLMTTSSSTTLLCQPDAGFHPQADWDETASVGLTPARSPASQPGNLAEQLRSARPCRSGAAVVENSNKSREGAWVLLSACVRSCRQPITEAGERVDERDGSVWTQMSIYLHTRRQSGKKSHRPLDGGLDWYSN